jgi:trk system potassium uptake protein TrkA
VYVLIIGGGKVGFNLAYALASDAEEVVVIDRDAGALEKFKELPAVKTVYGDGTDPRVLKDAGVTRAQVVVAATGSDVDNLSVALLARRQFGVGRVIATVNNLKNEWLFTRARGVDFAVTGARIIAQMLQEELSLGELVTLLKLEGGQVSLVEEELSAASGAVGKRLAELNIPRGVLIVAVLREGRVMIPSGETVLAAGDKILALAGTERAHEFEKVLA